MTSLLCLSTVSAKGPTVSTGKGPSVSSARGPSLSTTRGSLQNFSLKQRAAQQVQRVQQGIRSGALSPGEATRIKSHMEDMHSQVQRARSSNNGRLTSEQRDRVEAAQDRAAGKIFQAKHNQEQGLPREIVNRTGQLKDLVQQGIQNGSLTKGELDRIQSHEDKIQSNFEEAKRDGHLTKREIERIDQAQDEAARSIRELVRNENPRD